MPALNTAVGTILPAPVGGLNLKDPLAAMDPMYSPFMYNWGCEPGYTYVRGARRLQSVSEDNNFVSVIGVYPTSAGDIIYGYIDESSSGHSDIYDFSAAVAVEVAATGVADVDMGTTVLFNKSLYFFCDVVSANRKYNGSAWSTHGFTYATGGYVPTGACGFKSHLHIYSNRSLIIEVGSLNATSGSTTAVDLSSIFTSGYGMAFEAKLSISDTQGTQMYMAYGNDAGEVLIYAGNSPLPNDVWYLAAQFYIGRPVGNNCVINYQGDALIITETGLVSLKDMFLSGSQGGKNLTISENVDTLWNSLARAQEIAGTSYESFWSGAFWPERKKIVILANGWIEEDGSFNSSKCTFFELNTITGAWSVHTSAYIKPIISNLVYANKDLYFAVNVAASDTRGNASVFRYEDLTYFKDTDTNDTENSYAYTYDMRSAWNSFGDQIRNKKVAAFQPILKNDFALVDTQFGLKGSVDFGRQTTNLETIDPPNIGIVNKPYSIGIEGTFFQYQIYGSTYMDDTSGEGMQLYSVNCLFEQGGFP